MESPQPAEIHLFADDALARQTRTFESAGPNVLQDLTKPC